MHFASRLGLDLTSVRGIPASREDRIKKLSGMVTPGPDHRDAEIAALKARIAELELALTASATVPSRGANLSAASASVSATSSATPAAENKNTAPTITAAKLKEEPLGAKHEPWTALGISRRTYYRRKSAGTL
jgi:hypothetical protein